MILIGTFLSEDYLILAGKLFFEWDHTKLETWTEERGIWKKDEQI